MAAKRTAQKAGILERQLEALELRKRGFAFREIGRRLNISHVQASRDVNAELGRLAELCKDSAEELRQLELERLDMLMLGLEPMARVGKPDAVNAYLKVMERRSKLLGLDAPAKQEHTGKDGGAIAFTVRFETDDHAAKPDDYA